MAACSAGSSGAPSLDASALLAAGTPQWKAQGLARHACADDPGHVQCLALIDSGVQPGTSGYGWTPQDIQKAYNLPSSSKGSGQLVAIVDSFDNPNVAADLAVYRSHFGLGTAKFKKFNQDGQQKNYPPGNTNWGVEIDLDTQMVSAACPKCSIDLIEAASSAGSDSDAAEAEAVKLGAHIVSNSWICYGYSCTVFPQYFDKPGVIYTAGSGDEGYNVIGPPMAYTTVDAVGGTELSYSGSGYSETGVGWRWFGLHDTSAETEMAKRSELFGPHVCRCFSGRAERRRIRHVRWRRLVPGQRDERSHAAHRRGVRTCRKRQNATRAEIVMDP